MNAFELYLQIGFEHILDRRLFTNIMSAEGYDHLLFIVALAAVYELRDYKKVLILVTAFTIGHSVTLVLSTLDFVSIPMPIIEFAIPLTIVVTALFNILRNNELKTRSAMMTRYWAALIFGLIHGLGFSNYLKSLLGREESIIVPLLGFNVGLELGQIVIVLGVLILHLIVSRVFRLKNKLWVLGISLIVLFFALPILLETFLALFRTGFQ